MGGKKIKGNETKEKERKPKPCERKKGIERKQYSEVDKKRVGNIEGRETRGRKKKKYMKIRKRE